jgi:hypothetical protein
MEPVPTALIAAFAAAGSAILGGAAQAIGEELWDKTRSRLSRLARLETRARAAAFDTAVRAALADLRRQAAGPVADQMVLLLSSDAPDLRRLREIAVAELVLSARPDIGRLVDEYRRVVRFQAVLSQRDLPVWQRLEPLLLRFFAQLQAAMADQPALRPLLLERAQLAALDAARATAAATSASAATLQRIEALLREIAELPRISLQLQADGQAQVSGNQQIVMLGGSYPVPPATPAQIAALYDSYRQFLIRQYGLLDFRGIMQLQNNVQLALRDLYVPLHSIDNPRDRTAAHQLHGRAVREGKAADRLELEADPRSAAETGPPGGPAPLHMLVRDCPLLVVLGEPGAGKSTLVKYVVLALAEGCAAERLGLSDEWLPIIFPVAGFAEERDRNPNCTPLDYLCAFYPSQSQPDYRPLFERALLAAGRSSCSTDWTRCANGRSRSSARWRALSSAGTRRATVFWPPAGSPGMRTPR